MCGCQKKRHWHYRVMHRKKWMSSKTRMKFNRKKMLCCITGMSATSEKRKTSERGGGENLLNLCRLARDLGKVKAVLGVLLWKSEIFPAEVLVWSRLSPCSLWMTMVEAMSTLQPGEDPTPQQVGIPWRKLQPMESPYRAGSWQELWPMEKTPCRSRFSGRTYGPWGTHNGAAGCWRTASHRKDPYWSSLWRTAAWGKDLCWRSSWRTVSHGRDPTLEQGKGVRRKERQRQCVMNWLQPRFPVTLHHSEGGGRRVRTEAEPWKKGGMRGKWIWFYFLLSYSVASNW